LGTAWHNRGHDVTFGVHDPDDPRYASLGTVRANEAAASDAEVVLLRTHLALRRGFGTDFGFGLLRGRA
jgi:hypothetical protein